MKQFYESWSEEEIKDWVGQYNVLVLFTANRATREADIHIHGNLKKSQKMALATEIARHFGGVTMTKQVCNKINEFAEKWYSKIILKRKARVININTRGKDS